MMGEDIVDGGFGAPRWTADELEEAIVNALKAKDMPAVVDLLRVLVVVDPKRAEDVYDVLQIGMSIKATERT